MRTTLTLDDTLAQELKKRAAETGRSFKDMVNSVIARGLSFDEGAATEMRYYLQPRSLGRVRPDIDLDKALALAASLEDQEWARKMELRK